MCLLLKKLWKNDYFKTAIAIALIVGIVLGFFFGLAISARHRLYPVMTVESGSMCIPMAADVTVGVIPLIEPYMWAT